jgi:hypothetical protein
MCACFSTADCSLRSSYEVSSVRGGLANGARWETFDGSSVIEDEVEEDDEQEDVDTPPEVQLSKEGAPDWYVPIRSHACT